MKLKLVSQAAKSALSKRAWNTRPGFETTSGKYVNSRHFFSENYEFWQFLLGWKGETALNVSFQSVLKFASEMFCKEPSVPV